MYRGSRFPHSAEDMGNRPHQRPIGYAPRRRYFSDADFALPLRHRDPRGERVLRRRDPPRAPSVTARDCKRIPGSDRPSPPSRQPHRSALVAVRSASTPPRHHVRRARDLGSDLPNSRTLPRSDDRGPLPARAGSRLNPDTVLRKRGRDQGRSVRLKLPCACENTSRMCPILCTTDWRGMILEGRNIQ